MELSGHPKSSFCRLISDNKLDLLKVPRKFVKECLGNDISTYSSAILHCPDANNNWIVKLAKTQNDKLYMADGLRKFIEENSVENQDVLLFQHWGNMSFVVRKLDVTMTEKAPVPALTPSTVGRPLGNGNVGENVVGEKKKRGRPRKGNGPIIDGSTSRISGKNHVNENERVIVPLKKRNTCFRGELVKNQGTFFTSMFPFFQRSLGAITNQTLIIPSEFFEKHLPIAKTSIVLRNSVQKMWTVSIIPLGSYHAFSNGFQAFVEQNNLKSGDTCIFELVESNMMQVHFFYGLP